MTTIRAPRSNAGWDVRAVRDLAQLDPDDPANSLPGQLVAWLRNETWIAAANEMPPAERRAWLAELGGAAFDHDWGGYASFLKGSVTSLDYIWTPVELDAIWRRHVQWLLVNLSDVVEFRYTPQQVRCDSVTITGGEHLREALRAGKGVMALSVHQSHPGFAFFQPAFRDLEISTVANLGDRTAPHSSLLLDGLRDRVQLLPTTAAALRPMLSRLAGGGCVAMYCDYLYPGTPGTVSALLGGPVHVASAAVSLALHTGAAVIPVSVARHWPTETGGVHVHFGAPLPLGELDSRESVAHDAAALCFGVAMEAMIRRDPSVWRLWATLNFRWRCGEQALADVATGG